MMAKSTSNSKSIVFVVALTLVSMPFMSEQIANQITCMIHQEPPSLLCLNGTTYFIGSGWGTAGNWLNRWGHTIGHNPFWPTPNIQPPFMNNWFGHY